MVSRLREPFQSTIDDCEVKVCGKNVAIMMEQTCMKYIAEKVLVKTDERTREEGGDGNTTNKKQKKNSCDTTCGSNMIGAHQGPVRRDAAQQQKANEKEKSTLQRELTNIEAALKLALERQAKYEREFLMNIPNFTPTPYWSVSAQSSASDMVMLLPLYDPTCGKISKKKTEQFDYLRSKNLHTRSKVMFDCKIKEYKERMVTLTSLLSQNDNVTENQEDQNNKDSAD